jgi:hypothetical protein
MLVSSSVLGASSSASQFAWARKVHAKAVVIEVYIDLFSATGADALDALFQCAELEGYGIPVVCSAPTMFSETSTHCRSGSPRVLMVAFATDVDLSQPFEFPKFSSADSLFPPAGYPASATGSSDLNRSAVVNPSRFSATVGAVMTALSTAGVVPGAQVNPVAYRTDMRRDPPRTGAQCVDGFVDSYDPVIDKVNAFSGAQSERSGVANLPITGSCRAHPAKYRQKMAFKPFSAIEQAVKQATRERLGNSFYKSQDVIDSEFDHWGFHCTRWGIGPFLEPGASEKARADFSAAAVDFALLELGDHKIRGDSVAHKFWAIRKAHANRFMPDPLSDCFELKEILRRAKKLDPDAEGKLPVTVSLLIVLFSLLQPSLIEHRVLRAYYVYGFSYGSRVSEIAIGEEYTVLWCDLHFYMRDLEMDVLARDARGMYLSEPDELESIQQADKTTRRGKGVPRSHTLNASGPDLCLVRSMCSLKRALHAIGMARPNDPVFSWAAGKGVTRKMASSVLKEAAAACGIPAAKVSNHSLRSGAMTAFRAAGIPWAETKMFLRWKSDSSAELYNWPHTRLVAGKAAQIFSVAPVHRMRGLFVHCLGGLRSGGQ